MQFIAVRKSDHILTIMQMHAPQDISWINYQPRFSPAKFPSDLTIAPTINQSSHHKPAFETMRDRKRNITAIVEMAMRTAETAIIFGP